MSKDINDITADVLREMYTEAEPPLDFDEVLENPGDCDDDWYEQHYLDPDQQKEIVERHCDKHGLHGIDRTQIVVTAILDYGPATVEVANE